VIGGTNVMKLEEHTLSLWYFADKRRSLGRYIVRLRTKATEFSFYFDPYSCEALSAVQRKLETADGYISHRKTSFEITCF
jgi:hypothetical protein